MFPSCFCCTPVCRTSTFCATKGSSFGRDLNIICLVARGQKGKHSPGRMTQLFLLCKVYI